MWSNKRLKIQSSLLRDAKVVHKSGLMIWHIWRLKRGPIDNTSDKHETNPSFKSRLLYSFLHSRGGNAHPGLLNQWIVREQYRAKLPRLVRVPVEVAPFILPSGRRSGGYIRIYWNNVLPGQHVPVCPTFSIVSCMVIVAIGLPILPSTSNVNGALMPWPTFIQGLSCTICPFCIVVS
jgi:hypothetical protein